MNMFSLSFIFIFLPISVIMFYITPNRFKPISLAVISFVFYYLVAPNFMPYMIVSVMIDYFLAIKINTKPPKSLLRKFIFAFGVMKNLGLFIYFSVLREVTTTNTPYGIIIASLTGLGYLIDVYKREVTAEYNFGRFFSYIMFFPSLYAGPIVQYSDIKGQLIHIKPSLTGMSKGIVMFIFGVGKKIIIADTMIKLYNNLILIPKGEYSVLTGWVLMISFAFSLYFALSGFFDAARGLGLIFSLKLPYGFYYPFQARSLDDFFARFNIPVNEFVRRYVYVGLGGKNNGILSACLNIFLVSMLISTWYGIRLNCLVWGIYLGTFIVLEQFVYGKYWRKMPVFLQRILTFCITMMSFSILLGNNLSQTLFYLKTMFGFGAIPLTDITTVYYLYSNAILIAVSFFLCSSLGSSISKYMSSKFPEIWETLNIAYNISLLFCICALIIQQ